MPLFPSGERDALTLFGKVDFYSKLESVISRLNLYDSLCPVQLHLSIIGAGPHCLGELGSVG